MSMEALGKDDEFLESLSLDTIEMSPGTAYAYIPLPPLSAVRIVYLPLYWWMNGLRCARQTSKDTRWNYKG